MNRVSEAVIPDSWEFERRRAANRLVIMVYAYLAGASTVWLV
jgi:hypothetical protein